jgi:hypothetical protein
VRQDHPSNIDGQWVSFSGAGSGMFHDYDENITPKDLKTYTLIRLLEVLTGLLLVL